MSYLFFVTSVNWSKIKSWNRETEQCHKNSCGSIHYTLYFYDITIACIMIFYRNAIIFIFNKINDFFEHFKTNFGYVLFVVWHIKKFFVFYCNFAAVKNSHVLRLPTPWRLLFFTVAIQNLWHHLKLFWNKLYATCLTNS